MMMWWKNVWTSAKSWEPAKLAKIDTLFMLNNFCFHVYAQKSLFIAEIAMLFLTSSSSRQHPVSLPIIELVPSLKPWEQPPILVWSRSGYRVRPKTRTLLCLWCHQIRAAEQPLNTTTLSAGRRWLGWYRRATIFSLELRGEQGIYQRGAKP